MKNKKKKIICIIFAVILCASAILSTLSCYTLSPINPANSTTRAQPLSGTEQAKLYLEDISLNSFFLDDTTGEFFFKSAYGEKTITPFSDSGSVSGKACGLKVTLLTPKGETKVYDSTLNSSSFGAFTVQSEKGNVSIIYSFYENEEKFRENREDNLLLTVPLTFGVKNGRFNISTNLSAVTLKSGYTLLSVSLLPGIFTANGSLNESYYILPENSGFLLALGVQNKSEQKSVYYDAYTEKQGENRIVMPVPYACFSNGETLTTAVPDNGDALFSFKYSAENGLFSLEPVFDVVSVGKNMFGIKKSGEYSGCVSLTLMFCEERQSAYNTAASQVRAFYIDKGYLNDTLKLTGELPFMLTTTGSVNGKQNSILTSFEDLEEMVTLLNSKGVRSLYIRLTGAFKKGLSQTDATAGILNNATGSEKDFKRLLDTCSEKSSLLFTEISLLSTQSIGRYTNGESACADFYGDIKDIIKYEKAPLGIADKSTFNKNVSRAFSFCKKYEPVCIGVNDAVKALPAENKENKQELTENSIDKLASLNVNTSVMLSAPTVCYLKNADAVSNIFTTQSTFETGTDVIPFTQMVLHGSVIYGGDYVNLNNGWSSVLKCIEFGAVPSFIFTYNKCENLSYGEYASSVAQYYSRIKALKAVTNLPLTSHEEIYKDVYKVTYGYSKTLYINYTGNVQTVEGVMLSPNDFLLV